jgi:hypothetical protein
MTGQSPALMRRFLVRTVIYGSLAVCTFIVWRKVRPQNPDAIPASGGTARSIRLPESGSRFLQTDPQWSDERLGSSDETLGEVGCAVCSVAMAVNALGENTTPKDLNAQLSKNGGFTTQGWLVWAQLAGVFDHRVEAVVSDRPSHAEIDRALQHGEYPIVKIFLHGVIQHWVVVVGKEGTEYLVRDPLERETEPLRLSTQGDTIHSVRYVRRAKPSVRP